MTPLRFRDCLFAIRWNLATLANAIECDLADVTAWETGDADVPQEVAIWLEKLAEIHWQLGLPIARSAKTSSAAGS
jgi:ribosome-binding protein aMBF1 (putative translation factor)